MRFLIRYTCPGYETVWKPLRVVWRKWGANVRGDIALRRTQATGRGIQLGEATVQATKIKFYTKGDTLVYNADAFQLQEGSLLDGLIAQLPGAELKPDGRILVNGRQVESLLLNGRDFFKGDNTVLLDNLPAYMVNQVQVYEKESEASKAAGFKVDEGQYVMDVKLKRQYEIGWLGNTEWGGGTDSRYLGRLFAMRYTPHSRITLFGNLNNVNDRRKPDGNGTWGEFDPTGGLTSNKRVGLDYGVFDKRDRFEFTGNVDVNFSDNDNGSMDETTYFLEGGDTYDVRRRRSSSSNFDISTRHKFNRNSGRNGLGLSLEPRFRYYNRDYSSLSQTGTFATRPAGDYTALIDSLFSPSWATTVRNLIKRNGQQSVGHEKGHDGGASFWTFIQIPYSLSGFTAEADVSYAKKESTNFNNFVYNYYDDAGNPMSDPRNRYRSTPSDDFAYRVMAKYIWHWTREIMLNPSYTLNYKYTANDELHYRLDWIDESENQPLGWLPSQAEAMLRALASDNSYSGSLHRYTHKFVLDWQWNRTKRTSGEVADWYLQIKPSLDVMQNDFRFRSATGGAPNEQNVKKTYLLPKAYVQLKRTTPGRRHSMLLTASMNSYVPSMTNLVDKTFASNPLYVTLGNPDLKPGMDFDVYFHYQADKWLQPKERQLYGNIGYHYSANATSMSYTYDRTTGVTTSRPINVNGNWNAYFNFGFQTPVDRKRKFTFNTTTYANLHHIIDYASTSATVDPARTTTMSTSVSQDIKFNYRYKKLTAGVSVSVTYNRARADRDDFEDVNMWNIRCGANVVADLPWQMQLSTEFSLFARRGYGSDEMDRNDFVWNARLSKRVWKNRLTFMVDAWDMLGNLSNVVNGVNGQQRWAYAYNVIPRYVMLRAIYRLNIQPKKR